MNKAERHRRKMQHYRRRLKNLGLKEENNHHEFRSHGKPCSCWACSAETYTRKTKHKKHYNLKTWPSFISFARNSVEF